MLGVDVRVALHLREARDEAGLRPAHCSGVSTANGTEAMESGSRGNVSAQLTV
jgi:hypothetical protein